MGRLVEWWRSFRGTVLRPLVLLTVLPTMLITIAALCITGIALAGHPEWFAVLVGRGVLVLDGRALLFVLVAVVVAMLLAATLASRLLNTRASPLWRVEEGARALAEGRYEVRIELPPNSARFSRTLALHLNGLAESLERTERARRDLVANLAHELRTPLTNVQGYLEALRDGLLEATPEALDSVHEEVLRLVRLLEGIHQLAWADGVRSRRRALELSDLDQVAREILVVLEPLYEAKGIRLRTEFGLGGQQIAVHSDSIAQVLRNLLRNAALYTEEGGSVHIQSSLSRGLYRFVCINSGPGIDESDLPHIFTRFYRTARSAAAHPHGVGVGLPIARELVEAHGGRMGVTSNDGWTTFWVELPAGDGQELTSA